MKPRKVAIFDIDGTIFRSSLLIEVTEALIQEGIFPARARKTYAAEYKKWLDRKGNYDDYIRGVINSFDRFIKGVQYKTFLGIAQKVVNFHKNRVYRFTRDLTKKLRKQGYFLLAISKSPKAIVEKFCQELGFHKVYGLYYETDQRERFTGKIPFFDLMSDKAKILRRAMKKENLILKGSVGVGDSESDIRFLRLVEKPICFNPNSVLYKHGKRHGWRVVVERKDVIYNL